MHITLHYLAQLKRAAGLPLESVELDKPCTLGELLARLASDRAPSFRNLVLDDQGKPHPSLLVFVGEDQVSSDRLMRDGDCVTLLTPMAGG
jgi:molybdopterin converting factor small subunit